MATTSKSTTKENASNYFDQWCQMTNWHGILDFHVEKNIFLKITWMLLVLAGSFFAINQSVSMILEFASDDQWVTSVTYEVPEDGNLEWPGISICGMRFEFLTEDGETDAAAEATEQKLTTDRMVALLDNETLARIQNAADEKEVENIILEKFKQDNQLQTIVGEVAISSFLAVCTTKSSLCSLRKKLLFFYRVSILQQKLARKFFFNAGNQANFRCRKTVLTVAIIRIKIHSMENYIVSA